MRSIGERGLVAMRSKVDKGDNLPGCPTARMMREWKERMKCGGEIVTKCEGICKSTELDTPITGS